MQLCPRLLGRKPPIDRGALGIAAVRIGVHFLGKRRHIRETAIETLALQDTEFDLGHV